MDVNNEFSVLRKKLVEKLKMQGIIKSSNVERAFLTVPREEFLWPNMKKIAYDDNPLPLGSTGQTISAPHMIAIMLEELNLMPGLKILEIGAGSGYNAALLAEMIRPSGSDSSNDGRVISVERVPELVDFARKNLHKTGYSEWVEVVYSDGTLGFPPRSKQMLYDRIIVTAAAPYIPSYLKMQLKKNGIILVPVGDTFMQNLIKSIKLDDGTIISNNITGCVFVALIGEDGFRI